MRLPLTLAALALVPLALYARVATFDYVQADDTDLIRGNVAFLRDLGNAGEAFRRSYFETAGQAGDRKTYYRPLVILSFMVDAQRTGAEPRGYHVTNVAVHAAAVVLLFVLLRTLGAGDAPAFLSALLFAVHPAHVQAVAWIPGRNDTLMAAFALVALIALVRHMNTKSGWWVPLHAGAFAAALFTKETALGLLVLFVLYARLRPEPAGRRRSIVPLLVVDVVVLAVWYTLRREALAGDATGLGAREYLTTAVRNAPDLLLYAGKIALPVHLSVMPGLTRLDAALGLTAIGLIAWLLARLDAERRVLLAAWLGLFLVPALMIPGLPAYEHRLYVPLIAMMIGVASLPVWRAERRRRRIAAAGMTAAAICFAGMAFVHAGVFRDRYRYWRSATTGTPHAGIAHVNLGQIHEADGDAARAQEEYRAALASDPATPGAHNNLGVLAARVGQFDAAKREFDLEIALHPRNADAYFNVGLVYKLTGRIDDAAPWWERTIAADPSHAAAHRELAAYYVAKGDAERAARHLDTARAIEGRR